MPAVSSTCMCMVYGIRQAWYCETHCKKLVFRWRMRPHPICSTRTRFCSTSHDPVARTVMDHTGCEAGVGLVVIVAYVLAAPRPHHDRRRTPLRSPPPWLMRAICSACARFRGALARFCSSDGRVARGLRVGASAGGLVHVYVYGVRYTSSVVL